MKQKRYRICFSNLVPQSKVPLVPLLMFSALKTHAEISFLVRDNESFVVNINDKNIKGFRSYTSITRFGLYITTRKQSQLRLYEYSLVSY